MGNRSTSAWSSAWFSTTSTRTGGGKKRLVAVAKRPPFNIDDAPGGKNEAIYNRPAG